ncbi:YbjN domain-containing protein [Mangrovicella endophytica]|uniref:YbjN domain-containing protein n=1 Tax=Mangrovicella endophytica TaxID=2066697 RepID=UPI000C9E8C44|nr:YbjN domain-containing protein [Mangrovicella endophytica]
MSFSHTHAERQSHPVDVVELVASARDWAFERSCEDEIAMSVAGLWADYSVSYSWLEDCEALHLGCAFDMKIPEHRLIEVLKLLSKINEQLLVGHFDLWMHQGAVMYRNTLLLCGGAEPTGEQAERLISAALEACEKYYQAFQFVIWSNKDADAAMACSLFETVGEA